MPGVRVYPYKEVESGAQIYESLIWESRASSRLFERDSVSGLVNVDLTPEVATRLAVAFGTALPRGARVVASREASASCRMIERSMIAGLNSTGVERRRPARHAQRRRTAPAEDARLRGRLPRRLRRVRARARADPLLRGARDPDRDRRSRRRSRSTSRAASCVARRRPGSATSSIRCGRGRATRRTCSRRSTRRRSAAREFRIVVDYGYSAASLVLPLVLGPLGVEAVSAHAFAPLERDGTDGEPARADRADEEARDRGRRRPRRRLRPRGGAPLPDRRERPRDPGRAGAAALPAAHRLRRPAREARLPGHGHEPGRPDRQGQRPPGDPDAGLAERADEGRGRGRRDLRRRGRRRLRLPGLPARVRRDGEPLQAPRAAGARAAAALVARRRAARLDARPPPAALPVVAQGSA